MTEKHERKVTLEEFDSDVRLVMRFALTEDRHLGHPETDRSSEGGTPGKGHRDSQRASPTCRGAAVLGYRYTENL